MEGKSVKLVNLHIKKLYGFYNYDINFNSDVTFIYGANGCGKTTILNITEAIITGQLFKLFDYDFKEITLDYAKSNNINNSKRIQILKNKNGLVLSFDNSNHNIEHLLVADEDRRKFDRSYNEKVQAYFREYEILEKIKMTFNYVYLPLNRSVVVFDDDYLLYRRMMHQRSMFGGEQILEPDNKDITMLQIEAIIRNNVNNINSKIGVVSDNFRNQILKSLIDINNLVTFDTLVGNLASEQNSEQNIRQTQKDYLKILNDLSLINDTEKESYNEFFNKIIEEFKEQKNNPKGFEIDFVLNFHEILKIKNLVSLSKESENKKTKIRKPLDTFLETMNEFVNSSDDGKIIKIDEMGRVYFVTKYSQKPISIQYLSSGEKQLITFFTHLIFNVKSNSSGIFVVDEPELSLHLSWQKIFVEKTLEINKNIQLIFATHSPEIIGKNRNKMYKLEKKYVIEDGTKNG